MVDLVHISSSKRRLSKYVLPYEPRHKHLPGHNFCGPGTDVRRRLRNGVRPVNGLDRASLKHDRHTEPRGPYLSKGFGPLLRIADRNIIREARRLIYSPGEERWVCIAVIRAMEALLATGARGRGLKDP